MSYAEFQKNVAVSGLGKTAINTSLNSIKPRALPLMSFGSRVAGLSLSGISWHRTVEAPADFEYVRIGVENSSANPVTVNGWVAASSTASDPATTDQTIVPLTFNGLSSAVVAAAPTGREWNSSRVADNGQAGLCTTLFSDWMVCPSVPRSDSGTKPLVMERIYQVESVGGTITRAVVDDAASYNSPGTTRKEWTFIKLGDTTGTASSSGMTPTASGGQLFAATWIETLSRNRARVVMASGDSTVKGTGGTSGLSGVNSWVNRGCDITSTANYPVVCVNTAVGGTQHKHWCATAIPNGTSLVVAGNTGISQFERNLQTFMPTDVVILTWSTNDAASPTTPTSAEMRREFARAMYMAKLASDYGARVIFCTPFPRNSLTTQGGQNLTAYVDYVRANISSENLFDVHAILGNGTGGAAAGMYFDDSHLSELGHATLGAEFAKFLARTMR